MTKYEGFVFDSENLRFSTLHSLLYHHHGEKNLWMEKGWFLGVFGIKIDICGGEKKVYPHRHGKCSKALTSC